VSWSDDSIVRTFTPEELQPYFGVYRTGVGEWAVYGVVMVVIGSIFFGFASLAGREIALPNWLAIVLALSAAGLAIAVVVIQARASIVLGPANISYVIAFPGFGWSVPLPEIIRCELISKRAKMLRIITEHDSHTLLLTSELWLLIRPVR